MGRDHRHRSAQAAIIAAAALALGGVAARADSDTEARIGRTVLDGTMTAAGARAWLGVPYAAPPVGPDRWRTPRAATLPPGHRAADAPGPVCAQPHVDASGTMTVVGAEDCLTLNVYAPPAHAASLAPVMFFIHGGGQLYGTGAAFDGSRLALDGHVVVVTVNYRLGPLGWFHHPAITGTGPGRVSGQFALLDLIEGLRWVRRHIGAFGGDSRNVTIFGESAGAQNVYALVLAPAARGLFHRAIAESGGFWNMDLTQAIHYRDDPVPGTPLSAREVVAALLVQEAGAVDAAAARRRQAMMPAKELAGWLRSLPPAALLKPYVADPHSGYDLPSVVYDGRALPTEGAARQFARRRHNAVPLLVGGNQDEQKLYLYDDPAFVRRDGAQRAIIDPVHYEAANRVYSAWWNYAAVDVLFDLVRPVYAYRFAWTDEPRAPSDLKSLYGAAHGLELAFVFGQFSPSFVHDDLPPAPGDRVDDDGLGQLFGDDNRDSRLRVSHAMIGYWTEFARSGQPGRGRAGDLPPWPAWHEARERMVFDADGAHLESGRLEADALIRELWTLPGLNDAERCGAYRDALMYPHYPLAELAAHGCTP